MFILIKHYDKYKNKSFLFKFELTKSTLVNYEF